jgi:hypothetical protein
MDVLFRRGQGHRGWVCKAALVVLLLAGCGRPITWVGSGDLKRDDWECTRDARIAVGPIYGGFAAGGLRRGASISSA